MNQILYADIRALTPHFDALYRAATPERRRRADRSKGDAALRCLVSGALLAYAVGQAGIRDYTVTENPYGKPELENAPDFHFNMTHSGPYVAIAWGSSPMGIDLEVLRHRDSIRRLTARHGTTREQEYLASGDLARFYEVWTGKESYLKYLGTGINRPLTEVCTRSPELQALLQTFYPENAFCLTVCSEERFCAPAPIPAEALVK